MKEKYKAFNTQTGQYYQLEKGNFSAECLRDATVLDDGQRAVVNATFDNVGFVKVRNGVEWPACGCDKCSGVYSETLQSCLAGGMTDDAAHEYATDCATIKEATQPKTRQELFEAGFKLAGTTDDGTARKEIERDYAASGFDVEWTRNAVNGAWSYYTRKHERTASHTPGPWIALKPYHHKRAVPVAILRGDGGYNIFVEVRGRNAEANAVLIAQVPAMFEACKALARLAIERCPRCDGTGKRECGEVNEACGQCGGTGEETGNPHPDEIRQAREAILKATETRP